MSVFRSPLYLDTEILIPLANYRGIEVMVDVAVTNRDRGQRSGNAGLKAAAPLPGGSSLELGGSRGSESEVTQARTIRDHPANALNRLLDDLHAHDDLLTDVDAEPGVIRHQLVEIEADWKISPATDVGSLLTSMFTLLGQNPAALGSAEPPAEFVSLLTTAPAWGSVVLDSSPDDESQTTRVLVLLNSANLVGESTVDDLGKKDPSSAKLMRSWDKARSIRWRSSFCPD